MATVDLGLVSRRGPAGTNAINPVDRIVAEAWNSTEIFESSKIPTHQLPARRHLIRPTDDLLTRVVGVNQPNGTEHPRLTSPTKKWARNDGNCRELAHLVCAVHSPLANKTVEGLDSGLQQIVNCYYKVQPLEPGRVIGPDPDDPSCRLRHVSCPVLKCIPAPKTLNTPRRLLRLIDRIHLT